MYKRGFIIFGVVSLTMGNSVFPLGHGLEGQAQPVGQLLLGQVVLLPEGRKVAAEEFSFVCFIHKNPSLFRDFSANRREFPHNSVVYGVPQLETGGAVQVVGKRRPQYGIAGAAPRFCLRPCEPSERVPHDFRRPLGVILGLLPG